ncbi:hypothetical protein [Bradyrhizobium sp. 195]|nr:hypothetical protein IVB26_05370 [Bradyrhizobium sp. 195]
MMRSAHTVPNNWLGHEARFFAQGLRYADPLFRHHYSRALQSSQKRQVNAGSLRSSPEQHLFEALTKTVLQIDFTLVVMNGMLAFLRFAGALHVDLATLVSRAVPVIELATFATITSTFIVGFLFWQAAGLLG